MIILCDFLLYLYSGLPCYVWKTTKDTVEPPQALRLLMD